MSAKRRGLSTHLASSNCRCWRRYRRFLWKEKLDFGQIKLILNTIADKPTSEKRGRRVLLVDDEPITCNAIKMMLQYFGHNVETAHSAKDALLAFEKDQFDVIITDYAMPGMKGDELALAIKQVRPSQPIIMVTAHAEMLGSSGNPLKGIDCLIGKPFLLEELNNAIIKVIPAS